jgi:hypothetical protein
MNIDIGGIFGRAWRLTWQHKLLWIFGFLAALGSGNAPNPNTQWEFERRGRGPDVDLGDFGRRIEVFFENLSPVTIAIIVIVILLIALVIYLLSVLGRGGLIGGILAADNTGTVSFGQAWAAGQRNFGRIFVIRLVVFLIGLVVTLVGLGFAALGVVAAIGLDPVNLAPLAVLGTLSCLVPLICVLALLLIPLQIVTYFAELAAVIEDLGPRAAFSRAWAVLRANLGSLLLLGFLVILVGFGVSLVMAVVFLPLALPVILLVVGLATGAANTAWGGAALLGLCLVVIIPVAMAIRAVLETWTTAAMVMGWRRVTGQAAPAVPAPVG